MIVSELYRYPLKGGHAEALNQVEMAETGFPKDRTFVLVDRDGRFLTQRECAAMALIHWEGGAFRWQNEVLPVDARALHTERAVTVWKDTVPAWDMGDAAASFFSRILARDLRLCLAKDPRIVEAQYTDARSVPYYFADAFPYLIISQESLDLLNGKLEAQGENAVPMNRFRPNIVIKGWEPHAEDKEQTIRIGAHVRLRLAKPCSRCNVTTIDQNSGMTGKEPLKTLATYRKLGTSKIFFGMNAWLVSGAGHTIAIDDPVFLESGN